MLAEQVSDGLVLTCDAAAFGVEGVVGGGGQEHRAAQRLGILIGCGLDELDG